MAKDSGEDSWQLFLDLARDYKMRDSRLATVYIDSNLKSVLDRLKSATSIKLPSTAILSAIVARFVFEHEKDIKNSLTPAPSPNGEGSEYCCLHTRGWLRKPPPTPPKGGEFCLDVGWGRLVEVLRGTAS